MDKHKVVSESEWIKARRQLLAKEKEFTRQRDQLSQQRRDLPWVRVEKKYVFEGPDGKETLPQLFGGCSQLIVYHFMFAPGSKTPCKSCSFWADNFERNVVHLNARDVSFAAISRAPVAKLLAYRERMGWTFDWVSSGANDFNFDYGASFVSDDLERPVYNYGSLNPRGPDREGMSVFAKENGEVFHTYSSYARGIDLLNAAYNYLDLVPKGRDEGGRGQSWVRRRDEYEA